MPTARGLVALSRASVDRRRRRIQSSSSCSPLRAARLASFDVAEFVDDDDGPQLRPRRSRVVQRDRRAALREAREVLVALLPLVLRQCDVAALLVKRFRFLNAMRVKLRVRHVVDVHVHKLTA
jgi:hypothetical protein